MTDQQKKVVMVAAVAENGVIGKDGDIPWHISEDLKHFRETTRGNTVVMGRTTYEGIGHPLPYRTNVVVTRDRMWRDQDWVQAVARRSGKYRRPWNRMEPLTGGRGPWSL